MNNFSIDCKKYRIRKDLKKNTSQKFQNDSEKRDLENGAGEKTRIAASSCISVASVRDG